MAVFDKKPANVQAVIAELIRRLNDNSKRLRLVEQKILSLESAISGIDQNAVEQFKQAKVSSDKLNAEISELGNRMGRIEDETRRLAKQMERAATKTELREIQGFIDLINPIKSNFVTIQEVRKMIEELKKQQPSQLPAG
ncbi:MAG: hypothetical protein HYS53_02580 [Candidatus Aenigmarchaeota archaeon]|nr:hypothetical protein [Candidatus Aenigmarchaeota archaeon]